MNQATGSVNTLCRPVTPAMGSPPKKWRPKSARPVVTVPRDRDGSFTPRLTPTYSRRLGGLDGMIISLYAGGMTVRDIQHHLASTIGTELSAQMISNITDAVSDAVMQWQTRPLEPLDPVMYLDAIRVKIRENGQIRSKSAYIAVGVNLEGIKHVLGIWVQNTEGASFWAHVCAELANRGVQDVLIACCDGLPGLPEANSSDLGQGAGPNVCGPSDSVLDAVRVLQRHVERSRRHSKRCTPRRTRPRRSTR